METKKGCAEQVRSRDWPRLAKMGQDGPAEGRGRADPGSQRQGSGLCKIFIWGRTGSLFGRRNKSLTQPPGRPGQRKENLTQPPGRPGQRKKTLHSLLPAWPRKRNLTQSAGRPGRASGDDSLRDLSRPGPASHGKETLHSLLAGRAREKKTLHSLLAGRAREKRISHSLLAASLARAEAV